MRVKYNSWRYLFIVLLFFIFYAFSQRGGGTYVVAEVIDGDTIKLTNGEKVRYIGIDTPELHSSRDKIEYYAEEAYRANRKLVIGKKVTLEFDVQKRDRYGRLLAYVYVDGLMVNEWLVANGYARVATFPPNVKYAERFRRLEREARKQRLGLWAKE